MTTTETAELLARECLDAFANPKKILFRTKRSVLLETIPLVELLDVANAAELELKRAKYLASEDNAGFVSALRLPTATESVKNLETVLTSLRAKLPKGAL